MRNSYSGFFWRCRTITPDGKRSPSSLSRIIVGLSCLRRAPPVQKPASPGPVFTRINSDGR